MFFASSSSFSSLFYLFFHVLSLHVRCASLRQLCKFLVFLFLLNRGCFVDSLCLSHPPPLILHFLDFVTFSCFYSVYVHSASFDYCFLLSDMPLYVLIIIIIIIIIIFSYCFLNNNNIIIIIIIIIISEQLLVNISRHFPHSFGSFRQFSPDSSQVWISFGQLESISINLGQF